MKLPIPVLIASLLCTGVAVAARTNLVVNGSFEEMVHNFPAGWSRMEDIGSVVVATWSIDPGAASAKALKIACTSLPAIAGSPGAERPDVFQRGILLEGGRKYSLAFKAKGLLLANGAVTVQLQDTTLPAAPVFDAPVIVAGEWQEYRFDFTPVRGVSRDHSQLRFVLGSTGTLWLDDVSLTADTEETAPAVAPPKFQPRLPRRQTKNLLPNGSFECGPGGWLSLGQPASWGGNVAGLYGNIQDGPAREGFRSYRLRLGRGITPESYFDCWPPAHVVQGRLLVANRGWIEVEVGRPYTLSAYLRTDRPGTKAILQFNFNGDAREPVQAQSREVELTAQWERHSFTVVAPADGVFVAVGPDMGTASPAVTTTFWADAIQLEAGETATAFAAHEPVEVGVSTRRYGNVFTAGKPVELDVSARNISDLAVSLGVNVQLADYWDHSIPGTALTLPIPANANAAQTLSLKLPPGFYRARFSWSVGARQEERRLTFAVIQSYAHDDSPFGLNHGPTTIAACQQIKQAGVTWVRDWAVNWQWAEPRPGELSFAGIDPHIERLRAAGLNVLSLLPPNPSTSWASEAPASVPDKVWYRLAYAPKNPEQLFAFTGKAAAHYRGSVTHWEFLNEPLWVPDFCLPKSGGYTVATYLNLLKGAAAAIRHANPKAKIIGGLSIQSEMTFGDEFITGGGLDLVDILNLHPYAGTRAPETFVPDLERIRAVMDAHGGRKPIWATEVAYYGLDDYPFLPWQPPVNHFAANRLLQSEQQCGDYLVRFSTILLAHGVEKIFWHEPIAGSVNDGIRDIENVFIGPGGLPRKSYVALAALADALGKSPAFAGKWKVPAELAQRPTTPVHGYAFAGDGQSVLVAWAAGGKAKSLGWALRVPREAKVSNIVGAPLARDTVGLSESPVYATSLTLSPEELARQCNLISR